MKKIILVLLMLVLSVTAVAQSDLNELERNFYLNFLNNPAYKSLTIGELASLFYTDVVNANNPAGPQTLGTSVLTVAASGAQYTSVQQAVNAAVAGQTVMVSPGVARSYTPKVGVNVVFVSDLPNDQRVISISSRVQHYNSLYSNGYYVEQDGDSIQKVYPIAFPCKAVVLEYGGLGEMFNGVPTLNGITNNAMNNFTINSASVLRVDHGTVRTYPITFGGNRNITILPMSVVYSDPVPISCLPGDTLYIRTYCVAVHDTTDQLPTDSSIAPAVSPTYLNCDYSASTTGNGNRDTDAITGADWNCWSAWGNLAGKYVPTANTYGPSAVLGVSVNKSVKQVAIIGDSLAGKESVNNDQSYDDWVSLLLRTNGIPYSIYSLGGANAQYVCQSPRVVEQCKRADIIISAMGRNDIGNCTTLAQYQAIMQAYWAQLPTTAKIYQVTMPPYTTTGSSQIDAAGTGMYTSANLIAVNEWLRTCPAPLAGIIDFADLVMPSHNCGGTVASPTQQYWATGMSFDGTHPRGPSGCILIITVSGGVIQTVAVDTADSANGSEGIDYLVGDVLSINGGTGGTCTVATIGASGNVLTVNSLVGGTGYVVGSNGNSAHNYTTLLSSTYSMGVASIQAALTAAATAYLPLFK